MRRTRLNPTALRAILDERRLSQSQLARSSGLSQQMICDLLAGRRQGYSGVTRLRIAAALHIDPAQIETSDCEVA